MNSLSPSEGVKQNAVSSSLGPAVASAAEQRRVFFGDGGVKVKGIKFAHEVPAQWDGACPSMTPPIGSAFGTTKQRIVEWLWILFFFVIIAAAVLMGEFGMGKVQ